MLFLYPEDTLLLWEGSVGWLHSYSSQRKPRPVLRWALNNASSLTLYLLSWVLRATELLAGASGKMFGMWR